MDTDLVIGQVLEAVVDLDIDAIAERVRAALDAGADARAVLSDGLGAGVRIVGERFEAGEHYLTDLVLAGEVMKEGLSQLEPLLKQVEVLGRGTVLIATVEGDIHDIGKNLVGTMLSAAGYDVIDLGLDVSAQRIVSAVQEHRADVVGLSVLLTPMVSQIASVVEALTEAGLRSQVRVIIGGACTTPQLAEQMGCDGHGADAVAAVRLCEDLFRGIGQDSQGG